LPFVRVVVDSADVNAEAVTCANFEPIKRAVFRKGDCRGVINGRLVSQAFVKAVGVKLQVTNVFEVD